MQRSGYTYCGRAPFAILLHSIVAASSLEVGGYDETYWTAQDYDLWTRIQEKTQFANLGVPLMFVRGNPGSISATKGAAGQAMADGVSQRVLSQYLGRQVHLEEAVAFRGLMCAYAPLERRQYPFAFRVLEEVGNKCKALSPALAKGWFRRKVSESLLKHALLLTHKQPMTGWKLLLRGVRTDVAQMGAPGTWKQFARYLFKVPLRRLLANAEGLQRTAAP